MQFNNMIMAVVLVGLQMILLSLQTEAYSFGFDKRQPEEPVKSKEGYRMGYIFGKRSFYRDNKLLQAISRQSIGFSEFMKLAKNNPSIAALIYKNFKESNLVKIDEDY